MMSQPYVDGITDTVPHRIACSLTADQWFLGDFAVVTSRDGLAFAGEVASMDVCTGEVTIRGAGQLSARAALLRGPHRRGQRSRCR